MREGRGNKNSKKSKGIKKMPYDDIKDKLVDSYNMKARIARAVLDDKTKGSNTSKNNFKLGWGNNYVASSKHKQLCPNLKEVKKMLNKNGDIELFKHLLKAQKK